MIAVPARIDVRAELADRHARAAGDELSPEGRGGKSALARPMLLDVS
jgi:hypothetical protein